MMVASIPPDSGRIEARGCAISRGSAVMAITSYVTSKCQSDRRKPFPQHCLTHRKRLGPHRSTAWSFELEQRFPKRRQHTVDQ